MALDSAPIQAFISDVKNIFSGIWAEWFDDIYRYTLQNDLNISEIQDDINNLEAAIGVAALDNAVYVKTASDLSGTLDSTKDYFIDGQVDMGTTQIQVPESGLNISGYNFDNSSLFSSADNYTMFVKETGAAYAGYLRCRGLSFNVTGSSSKLMSLDNDGNNNSIELEVCNIGLFSGAMTSMGDITDYRLFRLDGCGVIRVADGLELNGTMSQIVVNETIALSLPAMTLFKEGTSLSLTGDSRSNMNFNSVNSAAIYTDIDSTNVATDGGFRLTEFRTTASDAVPNLDGNDVKALYRFCEGVDNTYVGAKFIVTTGATTTISSANTPVKMAGTTTSSDLSSFDMPQDNRLRYISSLPREVKISAIGEFTGGNNDVMALICRQYDSTDTLIDTVDTKSVTLNGGPAGVRAENIVIEGFASVSDGDYFELWVENQSDTTNIVTVADTQFIISER